MSLAVTKSGAGPCLVLLHGWGMNSSVWSTLLPELERYFCVLCVDLPGHGQSSDESIWQMDAFVDELAASLPKGCIVMGWSLGGILALRLASKFPNVVAKLILLSASAKFVRSKDWKAAQFKTVLDMFSEKLLGNPEATIRRFLLLQTQGAENQSALNRVLKEVSAKEQLPSISGLKSGLDILGTADLREDLKRLTMPVLQILGEKDQLIPVEVAGASQGLNPNIESVIIKGAAHVPFLSHSQETLGAICDFVKGGS